jgi:oligoendopeptidase F
MSLPARADVDSEYRYDPSRIFETPADWEDAHEALQDHLADLRERAERPLEDVEDLRDLLAATEEAYRRKQRIQCYASLVADVSTDDDDASDRERAVRDLDGAFDPAVAAVRRRLAETDDDHLDDLVAGLDGYALYAENLREQAQRVLDPEVEDAVAALEPATQAPDRALTAVVSEDLRPGPVERPDGTTVDLTYGNHRSELSHRDREYRQRVYEAFHDAFERHEHAVATAYAEKLDALATVAELRGYDSLRDRDLRGSYPRSGLELSLPEPVHDAMLAGVRDTLEPYHRSLRIRRERLGVDTLRPYDTAVPITEADPEVGYDEARELIVEAMAPLGDAYAERVEELLIERRVDVYPTQDKRTDIPAKCPATATDGPFVLANFREDVRTTFYVAHELGHGMNFEALREGPIRYATNSQAISEVPSILHELLLAEAMLDRGGDLASAARNRLLECVGGNLYGAGMGAAFTHRTATIAEEGGEVTAERARETYRDLASEFRAPVEYPDDPGRHWFAHARRGAYNSYQYVLGAVGALVVRDRLRDGKLSPAEYRQFLADTGREQPVALFERLGCDVTSPGAYERAAETFDGYVDEVADGP